MTAGRDANILLFNVNRVGDVLFSTAVIRNLRYNFPHSSIACAIPPRCFEVLRGNPYLDEIIIFDEKGAHKGFGGMLTFCAELRRRRFSKVFLLHRSFSRALLCTLAGITERIGYRTGKRDFLLTRAFTAPDIFSTHRADYYLDLLGQAGLEVRDRHTDFPINDQHLEKIDALVSDFCEDSDFLVAINPGGNWLPKRWPRENYAALARRLSREFSAKVIVTGGPEDKALAEEIGRESGVEVLSLCGVCSLKEFAAFIKCADIFITADSDPLHIAAASGARHIIALFGPTDPALTGPVQAEHTVVLRKSTGCSIPCHVVDCADNRCMKAITVDDVISEVRRIVESDYAG
ncbi:MAG: lipopolysaccharide heptosyltransferase II [Deltaproteobacteria bacterium]